MPRDHHHVVTKGLQNFFADLDGQVELIDKVLSPGRQRSRHVSASNAFVRRNFSSHLIDGRYTDDSEDKWSGIESTALPAIRAWNAGEPTPTGWDPVGSREASKMMAALHFARSYAYKERHVLLAEEERTKLVSSLHGEPGLGPIWEEAFGERPTPESIARIVDDNWEEKIGPNSVFAIEQMARYYNKALDHFGPLRVQALHATGRADLVLGDSALVIAMADGSTIGARHLALKDADRQFLPIGRRLAVMFTSQAHSDLEIGDSVVQMINMFTWSAAGRQVIAHPNTDLGVSLATTGWQPKVGRNEPCTCGSGLKAKRCHLV